MKTFSELLDIETVLDLKMQIEVLEENGYPDFDIKINDMVVPTTVENTLITIEKQVSIYENIKIQVLLNRKNYSEVKESAVIVKKISIEGIEIIPKFVHKINYVNERNKLLFTNYLGYCGIWELKIDRPFFQWYHEVSGQGMLIKSFPQGET